MQGQTIGRRGRTLGSVGSDTQLLGKATTLGIHHDPRRRGQQRNRFSGDKIGAQQEDCALFGLPGDRHDLRLRPDHTFKRALQILRIGGGVLVHDHKVHSELLQPEVFAGEQHLTGHVEV